MTIKRSTMDYLSEVLRGNSGKTKKPIEKGVDLHMAIDPTIDYSKPILSKRSRNYSWEDAHREAVEEAQMRSAKRRNEEFFTESIYKQKEPMFVGSYKDYEKLRKLQEEKIESERAVWDGDIPPVKLGVEAFDSAIKTVQKKKPKNDDFNPFASPFGNYMGGSVGSKSVYISSMDSTGQVERSEEELKIIDERLKVGDKVRINYREVGMHPDFNKDKGYLYTITDLAESPWSYGYRYILEGLPSHSFDRSYLILQELTPIKIKLKDLV